MVPCDRKSWTRSSRTQQFFLYAFFFFFFLYCHTIRNAINHTYLNIKTTMPEINEFALFIQYDQFMFI